MFAAVGLTMPLGPSVVFTRSAMAMAPTNDACRRREGCTAYSESIQACACCALCKQEPRFEDHALSAAKDAGPPSGP